MNGWIWVFLYLVFVVAGTTLVKWLWGRWRARYHRLHHTRQAPPIGTRPDLILVCDEIRYDLSDDLERIENDADHKAQWVVHGPLHLRMQHPPTVHISEPVPADTRVRIMVVKSEDGYVRFQTPEEISRTLADQRQ